MEDYALERAICCCRWRLGCEAAAGRVALINGKRLLFIGE